MSRYYFKKIDKPKGDDIKPFAVFGVVTAGHERLMNTAGFRYEKVATPAAEQTGLGDLLIAGGFLDADKLKVLRELDKDKNPVDREGYIKVNKWLALIQNAQIDYRSEQVSILTHKLKGTLQLLNEDLEGVEWPAFDWSAPEETVRARSAILLAYIPREDIEPLRDAAEAHYKGGSIPAGELGNSPKPSGPPSNGTRTASVSTTAAPVQETSV